MQISVRLTRHANIKIEQRGITLEEIRDVVLNSEFVVKDKFDESLEHFIGFKNNKFLRVIGRWINKEELLVVSAFYDRRLKRRRRRHDKD